MVSLPPSQLVAQDGEQIDAAVLHLNETKSVRALVVGVARRSNNLREGGYIRTEGRSSKDVDFLATWDA